MIVLAIALSNLFIYASGYVRSWIARRATPVVVDADDDTSATYPVRARYAQPAGHSIRYPPATRERK